MADSPLQALHKAGLFATLTTQKLSMRCLPSSAFVPGRFAAGAFMKETLTSFSGVILGTPWQSYKKLEWFDLIY
jgi:hypothetical protein